MARIDCISQIGKDGTQYLIINAEEPNINNRDLWQGGKCFHFDLDHKKQTTTILSFTWHNGIPTGWQKITTVKDDIFCETECLNWVENYTKG